jgi:transcriptional pleiotropic regulator of transition state genes
MKATGIVRQVDELGRVVLPIELRRTFEINKKDALEIFMENDRIILHKYKPGCIFCGSTNELTNFNRKNICKDCLSAMSPKPV